MKPMHAILVARQENLDQTQYGVMGNEGHIIPDMHCDISSRYFRFRLQKKVFFKIAIKLA